SSTNPDHGHDLQEPRRKRGSEHLSDKIALGIATQGYHPAGAPAPASPGLVAILGIAIFGSNLPTLAPATAAAEHIGHAQAYATRHLFHPLTKLCALGTFLSCDHALNA